MATDTDPKTPLRVLMLEDTPADAALMAYELEKAGYVIDPYVVNTREAFTEYLSSDLDLILSDHALPQFNAAAALKLVQQQNLDIPFIIVSGFISEEEAVKAMRQGAADYLLKDRLSRLGEAVRNALREQQHRREKKQAIEAMRQSEALNRTILASLSVHIAVIDQAGYIIKVNEAWENFHTSDEGQPLVRAAVGTNYLEVWRNAKIDTATVHHVLTGIQRVLDGKSKAFVLAYHYGESWFEMYGNPLIGGTSGGAVIAHHDITEQKQAAEVERKARQAAEAMNRMKTAFLSNMSHEIRTPLTAIIGFAEILSPQLSEEDRILAEGIIEGGQRLTETLVSILTLTQLESYDTVDLDPLVIATEVRKTAARFYNAAYQKNLPLIVDIAPEAVAARALVDQDGLRSILQNLLSNAIKFTEKGEIRVSVEIVPIFPSSNPDDMASQWLLIHVADTGIGIDPAFMPELFMPFLQESSGLTRAYEGSGLGLSVAYQLADKMHGALSVESEKGQGSRFTVRFPLFVDRF